MPWYKYLGQLSKPLEGQKCVDVFYPFDNEDRILRNMFQEIQMSLFVHFANNV
jgi:hypothetical protein